jgi:zinc D-Ala-D-Ala dipeptidase
MHKKFLLTIFLGCALLQQTYTQPVVITNTKKKYKHAVTQNEKNKLVDIKKVIPLVILDLKYASNDNFTKINLYNTATTTYLLTDAATALQKVATALQKQGLNLKIWDAYRPYAATQLMWELIKDERYVANPKNGSNHNRGLAIDLTIVNSQGEALPMGTDFDNFTDTAHHSFTNLPQNIVANRKLLKETMEAAGFKALETEWWHYSFITTENYAVIDLSFKKLLKLVY